PATVTSALPLAAGAGSQAFVILARRSGTGGTDPTVAVDLYQNGVFKANLATGVVINDTGAGMLVPGLFKASSLTSLSTTQTEVRPMRRTLDGQVRYLSQSQAYDDIFDKVDRRLGITGDLLAFPDAADSAQFSNQAIYGRLAELGPIEHQGWAGGAHKYQRRF